MFRYKIKRGDLNTVKKYLKTKSGKLQLPSWGIRFKDSLSLKGDVVMYNGKEIVPRENIEQYLRKRIYSDAADIATARDSAFYQLSKQTVGISRRDIMEFLRAQRTIGETRAALNKPKIQGGKKINRHTFETDLVFIKKDDLVASNPRFSKNELDIVYAVTTCEKSTGLCRIDYVEFKNQKLVTPIVIKHLKEMCKALGVDPKQCDLRSDKGTEFNKAALSKVVNDYTFVGMGASVENRNRLFQRNFYRILKNRQALTVPVAIKKAQNLINSSYNRIQKKSPDEAAEETKQNETDTLKTYNAKRKKHVSNTKLKELQVGDFVRVMVKNVKDSAIGYKTYKNKTYDENVYEITKKTKSIPHKYRVNHKWYLIDKLLKSAPRDQVTESKLRAKDKVQDLKDRLQVLKDKKKIKKEIEQNRKRIMKLKNEGYVTSSISRGIANLDKIKDLFKQSGRVKELLDQMQQEYERQKAKAGILLTKKRPIKVVGVKLKDPDYNPEDDMEDEEDKPKTKKTKRWYITKFKQHANKYLNLQSRIEKAEGETLDRLIRDANDELSQGQRLAQEIKAKNYKKLNLDLTFFDK